MDRELSSHTLTATRLRRVATIALPLIVLGLATMLLPGWMRPTVNRSRIRVADVRSGPLDAVISATGTVLPEIERVLASPVEARLLRVLKRAGDPVHTSEAIAELDLGESTLALDTLLTSGRISDNQQAQARLALATSLADLDGRIERQELERRMLDDKAQSSERLFADGLVSQQGLREARLAAQQAELALRQLHRDRENAARSAALRAEELTLERRALTRQAAQARRLLDLGTTRSDRDGVVTWVLSQEGALVRRGDIVARIADLRSYKIEATASDVHAERIRPGAPVVVTAADWSIEGSIAEVQPTVEGGIVRFGVRLRESAYAALRPNMRVDVLVITDRKTRAVTVQHGTFPEVQGTQYAFVIRDGRAVRVPVRFGIRGFKDVEVLSGLSEGDQVVVSDMRDYAHLEELEVR
jgi:HlyD family secretion protein